MGSEERISNERILHLWDTHVGYETGATEIALNSGDKLQFARAVLAATSPQEGQTAGSIFMLPNGLNAEQATACMEAISKAYHAGLQAAGEEHTDGAGVRASEAQREFADLSEPTRRALVGASTTIAIGAHARPHIEHNPDQWLCFQFNTWDEVMAALRAVKAWDSAGYRAKDDAAAGASGAPAEPIPENVFWAPLADNFYSAHGSGMGLEFYRKWKPRRAEFPQGESAGWGKGSAHNPFKDAPRAAAVDASSNDQGDRR